jgi:hypothetical protein
VAFTASGSVTDFAGAVAAIAAGTTYINIHTAANPGGEIRGQLAFAVAPAATAPPTAAPVAPAPTANPTVPPTSTVEPPDATPPGFAIGLVLLTIVAGVVWPGSSG